MRHAARVRVREAARHVEGVRPRVGERQRAAQLDYALQRAAGHQLLHERDAAVGQAALAVHANNVRVAQRRQHAHFRLERARGGVADVGGVGRQRLDGDGRAVQRAAAHHGPRQTTQRRGGRRASRQSRGRRRGGRRAAEAARRRDARETRPPRAARC